MSNKTKQLAFKASAPDEVKIDVGMEFSRTFKRADAPFKVETKWAKVLLRSYDYFFEFEETEPEVLTFAGLMNLKRDELNKLASEQYKISEPEKLADKKAVANAILQAAQPKAKAGEGETADADDAETNASGETPEEEEKEKEQG